MTSLQIQYFLKVADCLSFSKAAAELYVSQPSVSRQVKLLEKELGYPLFDRNQRSRVSLTSAGLIFRDVFSGAAHNLEQAKAAAGALSDRQPLRLHVGIGAGWDLSEALVRFRDQALLDYPRAELSFVSDPFHALRAGLRADELDVILCTKTSILDFEGLEIREVASLESRAYVRRGVLCPAEEPLRPQDFSGCRLFMLQGEESPMAMELVQLQFQAMQVKVEPVWLPNRESILQAVLMGEGFTVFDQYMYFRDDPRLTYYRLEDRIPICAVWNRKKQNPLTQMFVDTIPKFFVPSGSD